MIHLPSAIHSSFACQTRKESREVQAGQQATLALQAAAARLTVLHASLTLCPGKFAFDSSITALLSSAYYIPGTLVRAQDHCGQ